MRQRIADVESRVSAESEELDATIDGQRTAAVRLRDELESSARDALGRALEELQVQADDGRRAIDELTERLRQHEHAVTEQIDRAESEARTRIDLAFTEHERRQIDSWSAPSHARSTLAARRARSNSRTACVRSARRRQSD